MLVKMVQLKTIDLHKAEEPLKISDSPRRYTGILLWLESVECKDYSLLLHGVILILDAVGEYLRFILFLDDLYGRVSDRVFPKDHVR